MERLLGHGGMGAVYRATHIELGTPLAVKVLLPEYGDRPAAIGRFLKEGRSAATVRHPGIVQVFDLGHDAHGVYMAMELLEGAELADVIRHVAPMSAKDVVRIGVELSDAIAAAHQRGIVHRDLKPQNVFLTRSGRQITVKVLDFGIATMLEDALSAPAVADSWKTKTGQILGTPLYMSPEQLRGSKEPTLDVYAIGMILYECLAGRPAYSASTITELLLKVSTEEPESLHLLRPDIPEELARLITATLAKEPEHRTESARVLADQLEAMAERLGPEHAIAPPRHTPEPLEGGVEAPAASQSGVSGLHAMLSRTVSRLSEEPAPEVQSGERARPLAAGRSGPRSMPATTPLPPVAPTEVLPPDGGDGQSDSAPAVPRRYLVLALAGLVLATLAAVAGVMGGGRGEPPRVETVEAAPGRTKGPVERDGPSPGAEQSPERRAGEDIPSESAPSGDTGLGVETAPAPGRILVDSDPQGASVFLGNEPLCARTPCMIELGAEPLELRFERPGFVPGSLRLAPPFPQGRAPPVVLQRRPRHPPSSVITLPQ
ncbi:MAG: protein kinase [Sandaracinaceae bacterium]